MEYSSTLVWTSQLSVLQGIDFCCYELFIPSLFISNSQEIWCWRERERERGWNRPEKRDEEIRGAQEEWWLGFYYLLIKIIWNMPIILTLFYFFPTQDLSLCQNYYIWHIFFFYNSGFRISELQGDEDLILPLCLSLDSSPSCLGLRSGHHTMLRVIQGSPVSLHDWALLFSFLIA